MHRLHDSLGPLNDLQWCMVVANTTKKSWLYDSYQVSSLQGDIECDPIGPRLLFPLLPRQAPKAHTMGYLKTQFRNLIGDDPPQWTHLLYGVNLPIVMGIRSALLSSALPQILSPHGPLLNSTTWRTLGGTAMDARQEPSALFDAR